MTQGIKNCKVTILTPKGVTFILERCTVKVVHEPTEVNFCFSSRRTDGRRCRPPCCWLPFYCGAGVSVVAVAPLNDVLGGPLFPSYRGPAEILLLLHGHGRFLSEGRLATPGFPVCSHSEMAAAFFEQTCDNVDLDFYSTTTTMDGGKKREGRSWRRKKCQNGNNGVFFELSWERLTTWLVAVACVLKQPVENLRCNHWFKCYYNLFCYSSLELQKSGVKSTRVCM